MVQYHRTKLFPTRDQFWVLLVRICLDNPMITRILAIRTAVAMDARFAFHALRKQIEELVSMADIQAMNGMTDAQIKKLVRPMVDKFTYDESIVTRAIQWWNSSDSRAPIVSIPGYGRIKEEEVTIPMAAKWIRKTLSIFNSSIRRLELFSNKMNSGKQKTPEQQAVIDTIKALIECLRKHGITDIRGLITDAYIRNIVI